MSPPFLRKVSIIIYYITTTSRRLCYKLLQDKLIHSNNYISYFNVKKNHFNTIDESLMSDKFLIIVMITLNEIRQKN